MKKMNNKGFSLVELIVVIAIMAILAVTLAPRLSQYVEKSRKASDQEVVNTIFTAAKLANVQFPDDLAALSAPAAGVITWELGDLETAGPPIVPADTTLFSTSGDGKDWSVSTDYIATFTTPNPFLNEMAAVVNDFKLKSKDAVAATTITLGRSADGLISVTLDYSGSAYLEGTDYTVSE